MLKEFPTRTRNKNGQYIVNFCFQHNLKISETRMDNTLLTSAPNIT